MPNLSGERKKLNLSNTRVAKAKSDAKNQAPKAKARSKSKISRSLDDDELEEGYSNNVNEDEDDEDEIIAASLKDKKENSSGNIKFILLGAVVVLVIVVGFLLVARNIMKKDPDPVTSSSQSSSSQQNLPVEQTKPNVQKQPETKPNQTPSLGAQNFLENTNMTSDSPLTDPNNYVKDIYGLTTRVDYEVDDIFYAADFVSYTKNRGTWGGGLELYWLDAEYKGNKYVVQIPFKYYKELDDIGIVPVKMEVLKIKDSTTSDKYLSVISYMSLDEETLKQVLKSQSKK